MNPGRSSRLILSIALCVIILSALYPHLMTMAPKCKYSAQRGFFSHDDDPESWDFKATTRAKLGLLERLYPTDDGEEEYRIT